MKSSSILGLFLFLLAVIFTAAYYDRFSDIENVFSILFWYFILCLLTISAVMTLFNNKGEKINDDSLGMNCPGCDDELTFDNIGGYRCFCDKCVDVFPEFPKEKGGYLIDGKYPNFEWTKSCD